MVLKAMNKLIRSLYLCLARKEKRIFNIDKILEITEQTQPL